MKFQDVSYDSREDSAILTCCIDYYYSFMLESFLSLYSFCLCCCLLVISICLCDDLDSNLHLSPSFSFSFFPFPLSLRFPFYFELKIAFVIWLLSPYTKGSSVLYRKFVHPTLSNKEKVLTCWKILTCLEVD